MLNKGGYSLIERSEDSTSLDPQIAAHLTYPNNAVAPSAGIINHLKYYLFKKTLPYAKVLN